MELLRAMMLAAAAAIAVITAAAPAADSTTRSAHAEGSTAMYWSQERVGEVDSAGHVVCDAYGGAFVVTNRKGTWLNVNAATSGLLGFARRSASGQWIVFSVPGRRVGSVQRRNGRRWDVFKGSRRSGYVVGPAGPAAGAALLLAC
jgi:hypothetical protein